MDLHDLRRRRSAGRESQTDFQFELAAIHQAVSGRDDGALKASRSELREQPAQAVLAANVLLVRPDPLVVLSRLIRHFPELSYFMTDAHDTVRKSWVPRVENIMLC